MGDIFKDSRFTKLITDARYRQIPKSERKVKIDKRFQSMFENDKFKVKYTVDKRGRPVKQSSSENLKKYYDISSEESASDDEEDDEENERETSEKDKEEDGEVGKFVRKPEPDSDGEGVAEEEPKIKNDKLTPGSIPKKVRDKLKNPDMDYARGEGVLLSDSSSEEESTDDEVEELEHRWGELDADADTCEEATHRLAICNMDWDNIKAADLFVLFNSFLPPGGSLKSITIYPSEFGLKRMEEEDIKGPIELTEKTLKTDDESETEETEEGSKYHMEKLRQYQLNRLKYYYAVAVFDSHITANKVYTDCDGIEYESSASKLDLRFVPDDTTFEQKIHDECFQAPDSNSYKPRMFTTTALQQAKVELTWDSVNPHRKEVLKNVTDGDVNNEDLKNYLACSSSEEEKSEDDDNDQVEAEENEKNIMLDPISKYKNLLKDIEDNENKKKNRDVEMEISWGLGLKEKTKELVKKKINKGEVMTPFEEMIEKRREKKRAKKLEHKKKLNEANNSDDDIQNSSDEVPSDIDMNDPYFAEEFESKDFKKSNKKSKNRKASLENDEIEDKKRAELELLLDDEEDGKSHFSLKKIQEAQNDTKRKKKQKASEKVPDFDINVSDERFSALYTSHHFNIDPTDPNFKKTNAMDALIKEKLKRRPTEALQELDTKKTKKDPSLSLLVNSIKRKTANFKNKQ